MYNHGALANKRSELGLPTRERFKPIAVLPLPKESIALAEVMDEVYSTTNELEPFVARAMLTLKSVPFTDEQMDKYIQEYPDSGETAKYRSGDRSEAARLHHGQSSTPSRVSEKDWIEDRMGYLQALELNYKQFLQEVEKTEQESK